MKDAPGSAATLHSALLDYFGAPGKYQLGLRQPALLFSSVREILQIAAGRGAAEGKNEGKLREAAAFFIRAALLFPGADHYAVLGLPAGEDPKDLKERYRLLMRLTHPDFAPSGPAAWPADAAVRVNRAYEVLSSPLARKEYDEQLASLRVQRPSAVRPTSFTPARHVQHHRPHFGRNVVWALAAAVVLGGVLLFWPRPEPEHLVQRVRSPAPPVRPIRVEAESNAPQLPALAAAADPAPGPAPIPAAAPVSEPPLPAPPTPPVAQLSPPPMQATASPGSPPRTAVPTSTPMPAAPAAVARVPAPAPVPAQVAGPAGTPSRPGAAPRASEPSRMPAITLAALDDPPPPPPVVQPAAAPVPAPPPMVAPPVAAVPSAPAAARLTSTLSLQVPTPTLSDAQPLLTQVLQMLETGSGEQLLRLLDADARKQPGAQALSRQYDQLVRGARPVRLSQVEFKGEPRDGVLLVTGRIRMHAGEPTIGSHGERLLLKAEFAQRAGKVQLTGLSGAAD